MKPELRHLPGNTGGTFEATSSKLLIARSMPYSLDGRGSQRKLPPFQAQPPEVTLYQAWLLQWLHLMLIVHFKGLNQLFIFVLDKFACDLYNINIHTHVWEPCFPLF